MTDIVDRLRAHKADIWDWNGHAMKSWDYWRASIAMGDKSSSPRDGFEALIGGYGEDMAEAADTIERLRAALRFAAGYISTYEPHQNTHPEDVLRWIENNSRAALEKSNGIS